MLNETRMLILEP